MSKCVHRIIQDSAYIRGLKILTKHHRKDLKEDILTMVDELAHFDTTSHPRDHKWENRGFKDIHSKVDYGWVILYKYLDEDTLYVKLELLVVNKHDEIDRFSHDSSLEKHLVQKLNDIFYEETKISINNKDYIKYVRDFDIKDGTSHHIELIPELYDTRVIYNVYLDNEKLSEESDNLDADSAKAYAQENIFKQRFNITASTYGFSNSSEEFEYSIDELYFAINRYLYLFFETDTDFDSIMEGDWSISFNKYGGFDIWFEHDRILTVSDIESTDCVVCTSAYSNEFIDDVYDTTITCIDDYFKSHSYSG